jgi:lysine-ketoglutarate reductase/saccharopine dehydrogenase-like protein (TIGR00300 family)
MAFDLPAYQPPDFSQPIFKTAPLVRFAPVRQPGVAPENYHATTIFPEYYQVTPGIWALLQDSRMDCVVVRSPDGSLVVKEFRHLEEGEQVALGRGEQGEDGIFVHTEAFAQVRPTAEKFAFRTHVSRETAFSIDYDRLYELLAFEREHGFILWVAGPAAVFDRDSRNALVSLIRQGCVHGLLAGNALATHDLEAALFQTALGQEIYTKRPVPLGHYQHLDALNTVKKAGSIRTVMENGLIRDGVMHALWEQQIPHVLAGSIRDDGPLPEVITDVMEAQDAMRDLTRRATTVIAVATQLHSIAAGNMIPQYQVAADSQVRPVYFYCVDMSEFALDKLANRGSLAARPILTNAQDFLVILERGLSGRFGKSADI